MLTNRMPENYTTDILPNYKFDFRKSQHKIFKDDPKGFRRKTMKIRTILRNMLPHIKWL